MRAAVIFLIQTVTRSEGAIGGLTLWTSTNSDFGQQALAWDAGTTMEGGLDAYVSNRSNGVKCGCKKPYYARIDDQTWLGMTWNIYNDVASASLFMQNMVAGIQVVANSSLKDHPTMTKATFDTLISQSDYLQRVVTNQNKGLIFLAATNTYPLLSKTEPTMFFDIVDGNEDEECSGGPVLLELARFFPDAGPYVKGSTAIGSLLSTVGVGRQPVYDSDVILRPTGEGGFSKYTEQFITIRVSYGVDEYDRVMGGDNTIIMVCMSGADASHEAFNTSFRRGKAVHELLNNVVLNASTQAIPNILYNRTDNFETFGFETHGQGHYYKSDSAFRAAYRTRGYCTA